MQSRAVLRDTLWQIPWALFGGTSHLAGSQSQMVELVSGTRATIANYGLDTQGMFFEANKEFRAISLCDSPLCTGGCRQQFLIDHPTLPCHTLLVTCLLAACCFGGSAAASMRSPGLVCGAGLNMKASYLRNSKHQHLLVLRSASLFSVVPKCWQRPNSHYRQAVSGPGLIFH